MSKVYLMPNVHDLSILPQFNSCAKIEVIPPFMKPENSVGWYGGKPRMAKDIDWPRNGDDPMLFLAQIDCSLIPADLWGGVGPREGWLLVFVAGKVVENDWVRVIHVHEEGPERTAEVSKGAVRECSWMTAPIKENAALTATPFPKCLLQMTECQTNDYHVEIHSPQADKAVKPRRITPMDIYPVTWDLFEEMIGHIKEGLNNRLKADQNMLNRLQGVINNYESMPAQERRYWHDHEYEQALSGIKRISKFPEAILEVSDKFDGIAYEFLQDKQAGLLNEGVWLNFVSVLAELQVPTYRWEEVQRGYYHSRKWTFEYEPLTLERPDTYGPFVSKMQEAFWKIRDFTATSQKMIQGIQRFQDQLAKHEVPVDARPELVEFLKQHRALLQENLEQNERAAQIATDIHDRAKEVWNRLRDEDPHKPMSDADWATFEQQTIGFFNIKQKLTAGLPDFPAMNELRFSFKSPLWIMNLNDFKFNAKRDFESQSAYQKTPDALPKEVRLKLEGKWSEEKHVDTMGGLPVWDHVDPRFFRNELYQGIQERERFAGETPFLLAEPPFDEDNALLLQLFSRDLTGWVWGDGSHLAIIVPRKKLAENDFSQLHACVEG